MQSHKTRKQKNTVWCSDSRNYHSNNNEPIKLSFLSHFPDYFKFLKLFSLNPFFVMRGNGNLGFWSRKTIHYHYCCNNNNNKSSEEEGLEVSLDEESYGHRSLEISHSSSRNCGGFGISSSMTSHSTSCNRGGYVDIGGYRSQDTIHYPYFNRGTRVHVEGRGLYRSTTSHYSSPNQGERGRLLNFSGDTLGGDGVVGYMSQTSHSSSWRGDIRGDSARHGSRTEYIRHSSLFNVEEMVDGVGRSGSSSCTSPSSSHHSGDCDRSYDFYSYDDNISGNRSHTSQFSTNNHGVLIIFHPRFPQEAIPMGVPGENIHQNNSYYYYPSMPTHHHQSMPPHPHHNMTPHIYPSIPLHQVFCFHIVIIFVRIQLIYFHTSNIYHH